MMFQKSKTLAIGVLFAIIFSVTLVAGEKESDRDLYEAANIELHNVLSSIPDDMLVNYGFNNREEVDIAQLKTAYSEYFLPDCVSSSRVRILVTCNDQPRALLGMVKLNNVWRMSDFGASGLAKELGNLEMSRPDMETYGELFRDLECKYDYVRYARERKAKTLIPLNSVRRSYKHNTGEELGETVPMEQVQSIRSRILSKFSSEKEGEL